MKKYLITGALALVACATLTSCHSDDELSGSLVEQKLKAYEQVFEDEFGKVNPNQDWGFGTAELLARTRAAMGRTRANYANSNHWGATAESDPNDPERGWIVPDTLTDGQRLRVTRYFQTHPYLTYVDPHWTNFFVQQVYTGGKDVLTGTNPITGKSYSPEFYKSAEKLSTEANDITSSNLNYLFAYGETEHIANFNAATASYKPVLETGEDINNGQKHNDRINLMVKSSTQEFSYQNSYSSVRRAIPYVALVGAQTIDDWADSLETATGEVIGENVYYGKTYSGVDNSYWNRSFLGCDLELLIGDEIYVKGYNDYSAPPYDGHWEDGYKYFQPETYGETYKYLIKGTNKFGGDLRKYPNNPPSGDELSWLLQNGYLPVNDTADKEWVKPQPVADHYYSDWIVTLSEAKRQDGQDPWTITIPIEPGSEGSDYRREVYYKKVSFDEDGSGRVFCEDLGVVRASDIDFNDIVFDVLIYKTEMITEYQISSNGVDWVVDPDRPRVTTSTTYDGDVWLLAGGGTIPATIQAGGTTYNVKQSFEYQLSDKVIVNTIEDDGGSYGNLYRYIPSAKKLNDTPLAITSVADVKIFVTYGSEFTELTAYKGVVPHKICVPLTTKWLKEREEISNGYPSFTNYVKYQDADGNSLTQGPGLIDNPDTEEGGKIGDGDLDDPNNQDPDKHYYDERANSVWENTVSESLFTPDVFYTARHEVPNWTEAMVYMGMSTVTGGGTDSGYRSDTDPVLVRRRH